MERYLEYPGSEPFRGGARGEEMDRIAAHLSDAGSKRAPARSYIGQLAVSANSRPADIQGVNRKAPLFGPCPGPLPLVFQ